MWRVERLRMEPGHFQQHGRTECFDFVLDSPTEEAARRLAAALVQVPGVDGVRVTEVPEGA